MQLPDNVVIRPAVPDDAEALTQLHLDCWDDAYTGPVPQEILDARRDDVERRVENWRTILGRGNTLVAEDDGALIGFASAGTSRDDDLDLPIELHTLYVRAARWGTGLGHALMDRAIGDADCSLWVLEGNDRASTFYSRHGFRPDGKVLDEPDGRHVRLVRRTSWRAP
jgi:GNAT superfamily N-acetyltransferase